MHQSGQRALNDLLKCRMSLVFSFLCAINQTKTMTLEGTLDFHKILVGYKETKSEKLDKAKRKDFTENTVAKP